MLVPTKYKDKTVIRLVITNSDSKRSSQLTKFDVAFKWSDECQKAYDLLKEYLLKEPILRYPDPELPYILYTDASKYAWAGVLTQSYTHFIEEKEREVHHPITYLSGLFKGSQMNWAYPYQGGLCNIHEC